MKLIKGDIFDQDCDAICITTNGYVNKSGECVMGRGVALEAARMFPDLPRMLGERIIHKGHKLHIFHDCDLGVEDCPTIVAFPVKPKSAVFNGNNAVGHWANKLKIGDNVMGFACVADESIIEKSCEQLVECTNFFGWRKVVLPKVGCGAGELIWEDVEYILDMHLDDRFIICDKV